MTHGAKSDPLASQYSGPIKEGTDLHDTLLDERRRVVDEDNEGVWLDEFVHHLLKHEVR